MASFPSWQEASSLILLLIYILLCFKIAEAEESGERLITQQVSTAKETSALVFTHQISEMPEESNGVLPYPRSRALSTGLESTLPSDPLLNSCMKSIRTIPTQINGKLLPVPVEGHLVP